MIMKKNYMNPQTEVMQLGTKLMQDAINVINHSGGGGGFDESNII